ncbi:MAG: hypothetical protein UW41_C0004G0034, partial [Candidatus Collierbacteria bacterium GW2011_GWC2_44_18]
YQNKNDSRLKESMGLLENTKNVVYSNQERYLN